MDVHGRRDQHRRPGRHQDGGQQIIGDAGGDLADYICRSGGDDQKIGLIREVNVSYLRFLCQTEYLGCDRAAGEGLERQRRHKLHGPPGHHDLNRKTLPDKQTDQFHRLITGNPA